MVRIARLMYGAWQRLVSVVQKMVVDVDLSFSTSCGTNPDAGNKL